MGDADERLRAVLVDYSNFLRDMQLALPKHQPYLVRWVREFLLFARQHGGYTFEQTLDLFLAEVGRLLLLPLVDSIRVYDPAIAASEWVALLELLNLFSPGRFPCCVVRVLATDNGTGTPSQWWIDRRGVGN